MSYYVYTLIDPRDGSVFYVGKGKGNRVDAHEREAEGGVYSAKCDMIRAIWGAGLKVEKAIVSHHADENDAFQAEYDLIAKIGLDNLTNVTPGGVIGAEIYLARLEDARRRKVEEDGAYIRKEFGRIAPKIANALRLREQTGGFGMVVQGKWIDMGSVLDVFLRDSVIPALGFDATRDALLPHGVDLRLA